MGWQVAYGGLLTDWLYCWLAGMAAQDMMLFTVHKSYALLHSFHPHRQTQRNLISISIQPLETPLMSLVPFKLLLSSECVLCLSSHSKINQHSTCWNNFCKFNRGFMRRRRMERRGSENILQSKFSWNRIWIEMTFVAFTNERCPKYYRHQLLFVGWFIQLPGDENFQN